MPDVIIQLPGVPFNNLDSAVSIAALRAIASASLANGQNIVVDGATSVGDGGGGLFTWNDLSVADDNGRTIIKPTDTAPLAAGRWIIISDGLRADLATPSIGPRLVTWKSAGIGAVDRNLYDKLSDGGLNIKDFGAVCDNITDDSAAVQLCVNACLLATPPRDMIVPGPTRLGSSAIIDRMVGTTDDYIFNIYGLGKGSGFHTTTNVNMFESSFTVTTDPLSQQIAFHNIRFSTSSVFNTGCIMTKKFLRIYFDKCVFWIVACLDASIYAQTWYFHNCQFRNNFKTFFKSAGLYDVSITHSIIENGYTLLDSSDAVRGTLGLRIMDNVIEGQNAIVVKTSGNHALNVSFNHIEQGGIAPVVFDFGATILAGTTALIEGNFCINPFQPMCKWGPMNEVVSIGNSAGATVPGTGSTLHSDVTQITGSGGVLTSIGDKAGTISNVPFTTSIGSMKTTGQPANVPVALAYSADMYPLATAGSRFVITANNGTAFIIRPPLSPVTGQKFSFTIKNTSGGALGAITWVAYKMAAWVSPATGFSRSITFEYDGTDFVEVNRTSADVPN
jgi:hypothetical protein